MKKGIDERKIKTKVVLPVYRAQYGSRRRQCDTHADTFAALSAHVRPCMILLRCERSNPDTVGELVYRVCLEELLGASHRNVPKNKRFVRVAQETCPLI